MNNFWKKIFAVLLLIILILGLVIYFQYIKIGKTNEKYQTEINLKNALLDTVHYYRNKEKEWVAEKLTIQESIKNLEKINNQLTTSQKELLIRIKEVQKENDIIVAALIETNVKIDKLKPSTVVVNDSSIIFSDSSKNLMYDIEIGHVKPINIGILPVLTFNKFQLPNKQFIEFHWRNDRKKGYPIAFSVSNSNDYFKTTNIDSYAIPKLKRKDIDPNGWDRFTEWTKNNRKIILSIGIGAVGSITTFLLLSK
jgi:hypothetical protein